MRMVLVAASAMALAIAGSADAQRVVAAGPGVGWHGGGMGGGMGGGVMPGGPVRGPAPGAHGGRWGSKIDGRWWAGVNAPGGWRAYRHPARGWVLPGYWSQPSFAIADWSAYGLGEPPAGYGWSRYYDDAVLVDGRGQVYDCVEGVNWDAGEAGYGYDQAYAGGGYAGADYAQPGYVQPTYGQSTYAPGYNGGYVERHGSGVTGAVVGGVVGGVAGNAIAGRGNRLAGTLIGAGVGGAAGYAIDRSSTHRVPIAPRQRYDAPPYGGPGYPPPVAYAPPPPPPPPVATPVWRSPDGGTTVTTTSVGGWGGGSTTVVTVQTAPVVTTTTTEIVEDHVTYSPHRVVRRKWVRRPTCSCG